MPSARLALLGFLLVLGCVSTEGEPPLEYACNDLVVIGRVRTLTETALDDPSDILRRSVWGLEIRIKRVIHGADARAVVPAVGVSHASIRGDADMMIVLSPTAYGGGYEVRTLNVMDVRPRLASHCTATSDGPT